MQSRSSVTPDELRQRTFDFAVTVYRNTVDWLRNPERSHIAGQLIKASTSVAGNYRAACLARSRAEFTAKIGVVREEADETLFWLQFSERAFPERVTAERIALRQEAEELAKIFGASYRTSKGD